MFVKRKISNFFIIFHIVEEKVNYSFDLVKVRIWHRGLKHQFSFKKSTVLKIFISNIVTNLFGIMLAIMKLQFSSIFFNKKGQP